MHKEAQEYVKKCDQCQRFSPTIHQPGGVLKTLSSSWPFAQWGLDIVDPFPKAAGNKRCWSALTILLSELKLSDVESHPHRRAINQTRKMTAHPKFSVEEI